MEGTFFERELLTFPFDDADDGSEGVEKARLRQIIHSLDEPLLGKTFDELYDASIRNIADVLGLLSQYESSLSTAERQLKVLKAQLDMECNGKKNEATGKPYTRDAIEAVIDAHPKVEELHGLIRSADSHVRFLRFLDRLTGLRHERLLNANIDARRNAQMAQA